ncbi:MAG: hypothetical protein K6G39_07945 [Bacteroidales bacterium]|nr:hypothetical protein [Bacteroidales bacterium]
MSKKITYDLFGKLQLATIEREVEDAWNGGISLFFADSPIEHPFACDGFISEGLLLRLLIEYKYDEKLSVSVARARVLVQVLFYLKRFEESGLPLPNVIMVADKNECFVIHTNDIQSYLDEKVDWSVAPSGAAEANPKLVSKIAANEDINPFIFTIGPNFDLSPVINRIRDLAVNVKRYVRVTEHNIAQIFDYYTNSVLREPNVLSPHELVESFLGVLLEPLDYYQHPRDKNLLVTKTNKIRIFGDAFLSFFDFYSQNYTPQEKMRFTEITDRLIEDITRRRNGEFFTPTTFVDYAHRLLERELGQDWRNSYVVWDCCCGTKNLTRDYQFDDLYCSTLIEGDLRLSERYNPEACSFTFDFLNDNLDSLSQPLLNALNSDKPLCFILNPPYATSASGMGKQGKTEVSNTTVYEEMIARKMGRCSQNLYAQFFYRICRFQEIHPEKQIAVGLFSPTLMLSSGEWEVFRKYICNNFTFIKGIQFKASYFANVKPTWGISFSIWKTGKTANNRVFNYDCVDLDSGIISVTGTKQIYNVAKSEAGSTWLRLENNADKRKKVPYPHFSSAVRVSEKCNQMLIEGSMGSICALSNNVDKNSTGVAIFSSIQTQGTACISNSITEKNFTKCCAFFAARKLIEKNWINSKDEYMAPKENDDRYLSFANDAIVYSLFHSSSNQASLRKIVWQGKEWNVKNEFFWLPKNYIEQLANNNDNYDCYSDARMDRDRYVYELLKTITLSTEAQAVIRKANHIVEETFPYRQLFNSEHPEYQINNWDCGWYQIKALAEEYAKKDLHEFQMLYNALSDKMRPMVYDLGFLMK